MIKFYLGAPPEISHLKFPAVCRLEFLPMISLLLSCFIKFSMIIFSWFQ
jgi:hypothetical protein